MKILMISGSYPPIKCGVSEGTVKLSTSLRALGHSVRILTSTQAMQDDWSMPAVPKWTWAATGIVLRAVKSEGPDIIHIEYPAVPYGKKPFINFLPLILRLRFPQFPVIIRAHEYHDASWLGKVRVLVTIFFASAIVIPNPESFQKIKLLLPWKRLVHIPIGSNIGVIPASSALKQKLRRRYGLSGQKLAIYFGFIDPSKGVKELIESTKRWTDKTKLLLATHFDPANEFHREIQKAVEESQGQVVWTGFLPEEEISTLFQLADLAVFPYDQPVSMRRGSLIAALVHGVPSITTGPAVQPLRNHENCLTLENNQPATIASVVNELLEHPELSKLIRSSALKLASNFDWTSIAQKHAEIYQSLLK